MTDEYNAKAKHLVSVDILQAAILSTFKDKVTVVKTTDVAGVHGLWRKEVVTGAPSTGDLTQLPACDLTPEVGGVPRGRQPLEGVQAVPGE